MKKLVLFVILTAVLLVTLCGTAFAATPQDIWNDYNDNGELDGTYTNDELRAYLNNATLHQYPPDGSKIQSLDAKVRGLLSARDRFPFTGAEIAWIAVAVLGLLGAGVGLRRLARSRG